MSDQDEQVMKRVAAMANFYHPKSLHLVHVIEGAELPETLLKDYPDLNQPEKEFYFNRLEEMRKQYIPALENVSIDVLEGKKLPALLEVLIDQESDLVVLGRGRTRGSIMRKVVRKSSASVLIVPEDAPDTLQHALVATDFSTHSLRAVQIAVSLSQALAIPKITAANVYDDASKYVGKAPETAFEVNQLLKERAVVDKKLSAFSQLRLKNHVQEAQPGAEFEELVIPAHNGIKKSEALVQWVKDSDTDFLILGAKGQSMAQALFLGSFAEDVYTQLPGQTILLFKQKGENLSLIKMILGRN